LSFLLSLVHVDEDDVVSVLLVCAVSVLAVVFFWAVRLRCAYPVLDVDSRLLISVKSVLGVADVKKEEVYVGFLRLSIIASAAMITPMIPMPAPA